MPGERYQIVPGNSHGGKFQGYFQFPSNRNWDFGKSAFPEMGQQSTENALAQNIRIK